MKTSELISQLQKLSRTGEDCDVKIETRTNGYDIKEAYRRLVADESRDQVFLVLMPNERKQRTQRSPVTEPSAFDSFKDA